MKRNSETSALRRMAAALSLCLALATPQAAEAGDANGGIESNLHLGAGSRAMSLSGSCLARLDDASAIYWNPAALSGLERGNLALMHAPIGYGDAAQTFFGLAYPTLAAGSFGLGYMRLGTGGIQGYDADSRPQGELEFSESSFFLAYAMRPLLPALGRDVSIGLTAKTLSQSLGVYSSTSAGLDLGLSWQPERFAGLGAAVVWRDAVAPRPRLDQQADPIPSALQVAGSWRCAARQNLCVDLHLAMDHTATLGWGPKLGMECTYRNRLHLRLGSSRHGATFGVGLGWSQYALDYAYLARSETHPVSLEARFGHSMPERVAARTAARERELRGHLQSLLDARLVAAQSAYDRGDFAAALDEWKLVAGLDPSDPRAQRGIESASARLAEAQARSIADQSTAAARAARFAVGLEHYARNDFRSARTVWMELVAEDPSNAEAARYLEKTQEALREQVQQQSAQARTAAKSGDWVSALATWTSVRLADPENAAAKQGIERCRAALEGPALGSVHQSQRAARAVPADPKYLEALDLYGAGQVQHAVELLREVRRTDPGNKAAAALLAKAERQLQPLDAADRARVRELYLRGMSRFTANDFEQAIAEWTKILAIDPDNASIYQNIEDARARLRALNQ